MSSSQGESGRMPPEEFIGKFAPWLLAYDGATEIEDPRDVHAAQYMLETLQRERAAPLSQIKDAVAEYIIHGTANGPSAVRAAWEMEELRQEGLAKFAEKMRGLRDKLITGNKQSTEDKVAGFETFLRKHLAIMYADQPSAVLSSFIGQHMEAYRRDYGTPLFRGVEEKIMTRKIMMREFVLDGKNLLSPDRIHEYDNLSRIYHFGPTSEFSQKLRRERLIKSELKKDYPAATPAEIEKKYEEGEFGRSMDVRLEKAEAARTAFLTTLEAHARAATNLEPRMRLNLYESLANRYDDEQQGIKPSHTPGEQQIYEAAKAGKPPKKGGYMQQVTGEEGREEGPRRTAPRPKGPNQI